MNSSLIVFGSYVKTSIRNILKNKAFSLINIVGLAISLAVGLIMLTFINELNQYDNFHKNSERIYRVNNIYQYMQEDPSYFASTSVSAGKQIEEAVPGIEAITLMRRNFSNDFGYNEKWLPLEGLWATEGFFNVFTFDLIKGNPETALKEPNTMVITESAAKKLFEGDDAMGKTLNRPGDETDFVVTGVVKDPPSNSHLQFEVLGSFSTHEAENVDNARFLKWSNMWMYHSYMLLEEGQGPNDIQPVLDRIGDAENAKNEYTKISMRLQALEDITPGPDLSNEIGRTMGAEMLWMIAGLTFVVIISACFNYTNLSIAKSLRRAKEIGVRKVNGATRGHIFLQFLIESIIIAILALLFAIGLFYLIRPEFMALDEFINELVTMTISGSLLVQFFLMSVAVGILAGFLPALLFSRMNAQAVLKDGAGSKLVKGQTMRKILIVFQFTLSLMFIVGATIQYNQYKYSLNFDLGYDTENILNIQLLDNDAEQLKTELAKIPEVTGISKSMMITSVGSYWGNTLKYQDPLDSISVYFNGIDEHYLPLHNHNLLYGSNFNSGLKDTTVTQIIVNTKLLDRFGIPKGLDAIGVEMEMEGEKALIVGVVDDFHYGKLNSDIKPFLFKFSDEFYQINLKIESENLLGTLDKIDKAWGTIDKVHPIEATFYDERIEEAYNEMVVLVKIIGVLAFLAIIIAVMGLLGMVMFTTETRLKEISIRKVLGASEGSLVNLMGKGFMLLLFMSAIVAIPATYLLYDKVVFEGIDYRAPIGAIELFAGVVVVFVFAMLAIVSQTMSAARSNPATILRNE